MTDRTQFVTIDTYNSEILNSPKCSVIQGSKLSSMFYTLYTNEITKLYKIMNYPLYKVITGDNQCTTEDILHTTSNYVDDSTNIIDSTNINSLQSYINNYYKLLERYYNIIFLKLMLINQSC